MYYKMKIAAIALGASTIVVPPVLYKASTLYISAYQAGVSELAEARDSALHSLGLQPVRPEPTIEVLIEEAAHDYGLSPKLIASLIKAESAGKLDAYSPKGAIGLAQIMPANHKRCGLPSISKLWDERNNIRCGAQILYEELQTYKGDLYTALLAYNGGPRGVKHKFPESVNYAKTVMMRFAQTSFLHELQSVQ